MARILLSSESKLHSFTPTSLAMTALRRAKLTEQDWENVRWANRAHFFSALSIAMRHALIDHARHRKAKGRQNIVYFAPDENIFTDLPAEAEERPERIIQLDEAIARLCGNQPRLSDVIQQYYFMGYSVSEMAGFSGVSDRTVKRDLTRARVLLKEMLEAQP